MPKKNPKRSPRSEDKNPWSLQNTTQWFEAQRSTSSTAGASLAILHLVDRVGLRVAGSKSGVLITGEPGAGKVHVGTEIARFMGVDPVVVECEDITSEDRERFVAPPDGVLLILADADKLTKGEQRLVVRSMNSAQDTRFVVTATDRDAFSPELLQVLPERISIPPLRDHAMDVLFILDALLEEVKQERGIPENAEWHMTRSTLAWLACSEWPRNVDELVGVAESSLALYADRGGQGDALVLFCNADRSIADGLATYDAWDVRGAAERLGLRQPVDLIPHLAQMLQRKQGSGGCRWTTPREEAEFMYRRLLPSTVRTGGKYTFSLVEAFEVLSLVVLDRLLIQDEGLLPDRLAEPLLHPERQPRTNMWAEFVVSFDGDLQELLLRHPQPTETEAAATQPTDDSDEGGNRQDPAEDTHVVWWMDPDENSIHMEAGTGGALDGEVAISLTTLQGKLLVAVCGAYEGGGATFGGIIESLYPEDMGMLREDIQAIAFADNNPNDTEAKERADLAKQEMNRRAGKIRRHVDEIRKKLEAQHMNPDILPRLTKQSWKAVLETMRVPLCVASLQYDDKFARKNRPRS